MGTNWRMKPSIDFVFDFHPTLPRIAQLRAWATPRLLRFYKKTRNDLTVWYGVDYEVTSFNQMCEQDRAMCVYLGEVKRILNTKEHVEKS
jgi:hypothetical protein